MNGKGGGGEEEQGGEGKEKRGENRLCNRGTPYSHNPLVQQKRFICKFTFLSIDARLFILEKVCFPRPELQCYVCLKVPKKKALSNMFTA